MAAPSGSQDVLQSTRRASRSPSTTRPSSSLSPRSLNPTDRDGLGEMVIERLTHLPRQPGVGLVGVVSDKSLLLRIPLQVLPQAQGYHPQMAHRSRTMAAHASTAWRRWRVILRHHALRCPAGTAPYRRPIRRQGRIIDLQIIEEVIPRRSIGVERKLGQGIEWEWRVISQLHG